VYGLSAPLGSSNAASWADFEEGKTLYLSCGDSGETDLEPESVDAVVTDPPFFDNVHYSQLADFFYVWQRHLLRRNGNHVRHSTRAPAEVQQTDPDVFAERLQGVWRECHRVLKPDGLLVFSYHHSRGEGWRCVLQALVGAGFRIVAVHPMKAEMSVAMPKHQASEPIDLDVILVCRKRGEAASGSIDLGETIRDSGRDAEGQISRLRDAGRRLSRNDVRIVLMAQIIKRLSERQWAAALVEQLDQAAAVMESEIDRLFSAARPSTPRA
jgi:adenine-specific DNA methylase